MLARKPSTPVCPFTIQSLDSGSQEEHLVFLKTSILSIQSVVSDHKEMLIKCLGRRVEKSSPGQGIFSSSSNNNKPDKNLITDHSTDGKFSIYSGFFDKKFVDTLSKRSDVNFVEKVIKIKANYAVNNTVIIEEDQLKKRAATSTPTQNGLPYNLDRIDQKDFPLDGKYNYPTSAGIDIKNAEFEGRASFGGSFCAGCSSTDDNGHGTNVAGIIGGKKYGVANKATLIAIKVLDQSGQGSSTTVVAGLSYVILQHSKRAYSQAINQMISLCSNAGIHVVVSAGDDSSNACNVSPASAPQAITVGATEKSTNKITNLTNTGSCVKIFAPGVDIVAAGALLTNSLSKASGTSQACPHVAGTVALIISKKGNMNPSLMINELITLSTKNILTNLQNATPNRFLRIPSP
ncbi:13128_t:CDS:2 [Rhizophagus irregularis]|nr:13128_t:CDS:2 [Rhizophagus irregularis]